MRSERHAEARVGWRLALLALLGLGLTGCIQEGVVLEVRSAQIPNVSATAGYARNADEISSNGRDHNWSVNITARQVVFAGGGVTASVKSQQLSLDAAVLALRAVINDVLLQVRTQFYGVLVARVCALSVGRHALLHEQVSRHTASKQQDQQHPHHNENELLLALLGGFAFGLGGCGGS